MRLIFRIFCVFPDVSMSVYSVTSKIFREQKNDGKEAECLLR